jgi:hypothetical protein
LSPLGSFSGIAGTVARLTAIEKRSRLGSEQFAWRIRREGANYGHTVMSEAGYREVKDRLNRVISVVKGLDQRLSGSCRLRLRCVLFSLYSVNAGLTELLMKLSLKQSCRVGLHWILRWASAQ